jgi:hypothetical protein
VPTRTRVAIGWASFSAAALVLALGTALVASRPTPARAQGSTYVRVAEAAPAAPAVDIYLDGGATPLLANFTLGTVTGYVPWTAGPHTVSIVPVGKGLGAAIATTPVTVANGESYTVAVVGDSHYATAAALIPDDNVIVSGMGKVRFYHLSSNAGPAALSMAFGQAGKTTIPRIGFEQTSDYVSLRAGTYTFFVTLQGGATTVPQALTLRANEVTSIFGIGDVGAKGATAFRFVVATAQAVPTALPPTGFAPRTAARPAILGVTMGLAAALALLATIVFMGMLFGTPFAMRHPARPKAGDRVRRLATTPPRRRPVETVSGR